MDIASGLMSIDQAAALIEAGHYLSIAGDEAALRRLPKGNWIGGTTAYFMAATGGRVTRDEVFVQPVPVLAEAPDLRLYDPEALPQLCRNAPESGYTLLVVPAFGPCHARFAENAPNYEEMFLKPLVGWVAGVHLDELGSNTPKVVLGTTGEFSDQHAVAMQVPLPPERFARVEIVNLFRAGNGPEIRFDATGFAATTCCIDGETARFADYLSQAGIDTRLPLVADYCGAMINVSIKAVDVASGRVEFYAPVFREVAYRIAAPVADYVAGFRQALPDSAITPGFSCNCILNFLYSGLEGQRTGEITGPITFGEIGYQLLNQTLVYLVID